jgi:hypothetical protein
MPLRAGVDGQASTATELVISLPAVMPTEEIVG